MSLDLKTMKVLVVEDTMTQAMMIQHVLEKHGIDSSIARSGAKALAALQSFRPDLILSDVNMPEMSGFELCKQVKEDETNRHIPFVLLSTLVDSADLLRVIESGADNFIYKTFEGDYFIDRLKTIALTVNTESEVPAAAVNVTLYVKEKEHHVSLSSTRLAALLSSAFEAAVVRSRAGE